MSPEDVPGRDVAGHRGNGRSFILRLSTQSKGPGVGLSGFHPAADHDNPNDLEPVAVPLSAHFLTCKSATMVDTSTRIVMRMSYYFSSTLRREPGTEYVLAKLLFLDSAQ